MLIGRGKELAACEQVLAAGKPALILVTSEPGMGRTSLLQELRATVTNRYQYYRLLPPEEQKFIGIDRKTTEDSFRQATKPPATAAPSGLELSPDLGRRAQEPLTVILIDGYWPNKQFAKWFFEGFIANLPNERPPRIIAVAAYTSDAMQLHDAARRTSVDVLELKLGPLDEQAVEAHLRELDRETQARMGDPEMLAYTNALREAPDLIGAFDRLLRLDAAASVGMRSSVD